MKEFQVIFLVLFLTFESLAAYHFTHANYGNSYSNCITVARRKRCGYHERNSPFRTVTGSCNNVHYSTWGSAHIPLRRLIDAEYADHHRLDVPRGYPGIGSVLPTANEVSRKLFTVTKKDTGNKKHLSTLFMTVGQFLDHDITETPKARCSVKKCDKKSSFYYPCFSILFKNNDYSRCTPFGRSKAACRRRKGVRQQVNELSSFVDGSQIYSSDKKHFKKLRKLDGSGQLKLEKSGLILTDSSIKNCRTKGGCSLVGDKRGDENMALYCMHTLWVREHNRIATELKQFNPHWKEEKLFQTARKITGALWQHIVFEEWLPLVTRRKGYHGYKRWVNPGLTNAFSTAAFRFGHSLIPDSFSMLDKNFDKLYEPMTLQSVFHNREPANRHGIEPMMYGLIGNKSNTVDTEFAFSIARRLFVAPGKNDYHDLTARNIQRGRDHGLPTYGAYRERCGLRKVKSWRQLSRYMPLKAVKALKLIYKSPYDIDLFAAGIAEYHIRNGVVGPVFSCIIRHQFWNLKHGDRYHYRAPGMFNRKQRKAIFKTRMSTILCNNLKGIVSIQKHAFFTAGKVKNRRIVCNDIPKLDLHYWKEGNHEINHGYDKYNYKYGRNNEIGFDDLDKEDDYNPHDEDDDATVEPYDRFETVENESDEDEESASKGESLDTTSEDPESTEKENHGKNILLQLKEEDEKEQLKEKSNW